MWRSLSLVFLLISCGACSEKPVSGSCPTVLPRWTKPKDGLSSFRPISFIQLSGGQPTWDGESLSHAELERRLKLSADMNPRWHVLFDPSGARNCAEATELRDEINRFADCKGTGVCGQGASKEFIRLKDEGRSGNWGIE